MMTVLTDLSIAAMKSGLRTRDFTAVELTEAHLDAMARARHLNAFIVETPDIARAQAVAADAALAAGTAGPLAGIPIGIKDLFCTAGVQTTAGSNILKGFTPQYESTVSGKLLADGAVMLGKLNMDEFAMGSSNETSAFGKVISPWHANGSDGQPGARRLVGRIGGGGRGADRRRRHRHRHRRIDPAAGELCRHRRDQADLWPLLALGRRRLRLVARPGRADGAHGERLRVAADVDVRP